MANVGSAPSPDVFVYAGHGNELPIPYEERPPVPPGTTVVLFAGPGQPLPAYQAEDIWKKMYANPELFKNPIANKHAIEELIRDRIRVYPEGSPMPVMNYWPEGSMSEGVIGTTVYNAGIYKFPLELPAMININIKKRSFITPSEINTLYPGTENTEIKRNILDMVQTADGNLQLPSQFVSITNLKTIKYTTPDLVASKGAGVHYLLNCRYVADLKNKIRQYLQPLQTITSRIRNEKMAPYRKYLSQLSSYDINSETRRLMNEHVPTNVRNTMKNLDEYYSVLQHSTPENTLPELKQLIFKHTYLPENTALNSEPFSNENWAKNMATSLNDPETQVLNRKRTIAKQFNSEFGTLQRKLGLTRQKSQEFQTTRFSRPAAAAAAAAAANTRKRRNRRKTRKNRR